MAWWKRSCEECKTLSPGGREEARLSGRVTITGGQDCRVVVSSAFDVVSLGWQRAPRAGIPTEPTRGCVASSQNFVWKESNRSHRWANLPSEPEEPSPNHHHVPHLRTEQKEELSWNYVQVPRGGEL